MRGALPAVSAIPDIKKARSGILGLVDVGLPRQHRFDGLLWVFRGIALRQRKSLEALGAQGSKAMPRQTAAGKRDVAALPAQHSRQRQTAGNVAAADGWRGVGTNQNSHCNSPPALSAA